MKWNKFRLKTTTESEDIVSSMLMDLGIQGIEIEDKIPLTQSDKEQMFVDILPEIEADDGVAYISFYLEEDEDKEEVLANVKKELERCGHIRMWGRVPLKNHRLKMWIGSTIGNSTSTNFMWMMCSSFRRGKR